MSFVNPQNLAEKFGILSGMQVADLGCAGGEYSLAAARLVGDNGRVYAIDIQKEILSNIRKTAEKNNFFNLEVIWGNIEKLGGTRLADNSIDLAIASNILFQVESKTDFIKEAWRILKPFKGRICVIDWTDSFGGLGPETKAVVSPEKAKSLFEIGGFVFEKELKDCGAHHYGLIFRKV